MNPHGARRARAKFAGGALLPLLAFISLGADAQAWLPQKGSMSFSADYSEILNKKHYKPDGSEVDVGHTDVNILSLSASYSPTDRISIGASLPFVRSRFRGEPLGGHDTPMDDGTWHSTFTDLQLTVSYQLVNSAFGLAPYVGVVVPTHDYTTFGHSAPGRGLNEVWLGTYAAMSLNEWIPRTYVQVRGNYAFVEKLADVSHDRINATLEIGYFPSPVVNLRLLASEQWTQGGIDVPVLPLLPDGTPNPDYPILFPHHDALAAEEFVSVGGGGTWVLNPRTSVYAFYMTMIEGSNAHKADYRFTLGVSYGVGGH